MLAVFLHRLDRHEAATTISRVRILSSDRRGLPQINT
jgi:hypothetical protein